MRYQFFEDSATKSILAAVDLSEVSTDVIAKAGGPPRLLLFWVQNANLRNGRLPIGVLGLLRQDPPTLICRLPIPTDERDARITVFTVLRVANRFIVVLSHVFPGLRFPPLTGRTAVPTDMQNRRVGIPADLNAAAGQLGGKEEPRVVPKRELRGLVLQPGQPVRSNLFAVNASRPTTIGEQLEFDAAECLVAQIKIIDALLRNNSTVVHPGERSQLTR
jgi:hypothetical protein